MLSRIDGISADIATVQDRIDAQLGELAPAVTGSMRFPASGRSPRR